MEEKSRHVPARAGCLAALTALPLLAVSIMALALAGGDSAEAMYLVDDSDYIHVDELSEEIFLTDGSSELLSKTDGNDLLLTAGVDVTVCYQGRRVSTVAREETVSALLSRLGIRSSPLEMVALTNADGALEIAIDSEFVFYEHISSVTEHETVYRYNDRLPAWEENVIQQGQDGEYSETYEIIYQDGVETIRQLIDVVDTEPVTAIIEKGTIVNFANNADPVSSIVTNADGTGTITLENGVVLTFREAKTMRATAYSSEEPTVGTITASGTPVHVGVVAVDRRVIPLGTKVYVVTNDGSYIYGFAVAEDTGVRGDIIDLYMDTVAECIQFGVRGCTVYILD